MVPGVLRGRPGRCNLSRTGGGVRGAGPGRDTEVRLTQQESLAERVRRVVRAVTPLVEERAKQEAAISQRLKEQTAIIDREHKQAVAARETATTNGKQAIESEKLALMDLVRAKHEKEWGEAHANMTADLAAFADTTARLEARAEQKLEDAKWLAETLVESGEGKARAEFETAAKDHKMRQDEVELVRVRAALRSSFTDCVCRWLCILVTFWQCRWTG